MLRKNQLMRNGTQAHELEEPLGGLKIMSCSEIASTL